MDKNSNVIATAKYDAETFEVLVKRQVNSAQVFLSNFSEYKHKMFFLDHNGEPMDVADILLVITSEAV
jgi:hypothetical protein